MFLLAVLDNGDAFVSEFRTLTKIEKYVTEVYAGLRPFNLWRVASETHPVSGERVAMRVRVLINGKRIVTITEVAPVAGKEQSHDYDTENFKGVIRPAQAKGRRNGRITSLGLWKAPTDNAPEQAVAGAEYPTHADESERPYVILKAGTREAEQVDEVRYYIDGLGLEPASRMTPVAEFDTMFDDDDNEESELS